MKKYLVKYISFIVFLAFAVQLAAPHLPAYQAKMQDMEFTGTESQKESREKDRQSGFEELADAVPGNIEIAVLLPHISHYSATHFTSLPNPEGEVPVPPPDCAC